MAQELRIVEISRLETDLGVLRLATLEGALIRIDLRPDGAGSARPAVGAPVPGHVTDHPGPDLQAWLRWRGLRVVLRPRSRPSGRISRGLQRYLSDRSRRLDLAFRAFGTPFQLRVWKALCAIPYGQTRTYGQIAKKIGVAGACRAVGRACGANPLPILVPCHRVVAVGGKSGGFGCGLDMKRKLLEIEGLRPDW